MYANNEEFVRLLDNSGWSQREAARKLGVTSAAVTHWVQGKHRIEDSHLMHFKRIVADDIPLPGKAIEDRQITPDSNEAELLLKLRSFPQADRRAFIAHVKGLADLISKPDVGYLKSRAKDTLLNPASSASVSEREVILDEAEALDPGTVESEHLREADAPSERKARPSEDVSPETKRPRGAPKPARGERE